MIRLPGFFVETKIVARPRHIGVIGRYCRVGEGYKRKSSSPIATGLRQINILREAKSRCTFYALKRCLRGVTHRDVLTGDEGDASSAEFSDAYR